MGAILATLIYVAILVLAVREACMAWFQTEKYLEKTRKWQAKFPSYLKSVTNETMALWQARIGMPIAIVILSCYVLSFISLIE